MNSVNLIGRIVDEPELRVAATGEEQCAMRVAVPRIARGGAPEPGVVYVEVVATGLNVRELADEVLFGMRIGVSGRIDLDEWVGADGERHTRFEVMADQLEVLDTREDDAPLGGGRAAA